MIDDSANNMTIDYTSDDLFGDLNYIDSHFLDFHIFFLRVVKIKNLFLSHTFDIHCLMHNLISIICLYFIYIHVENFILYYIIYFS